ncbi:MAG: retropepsin-like aspartic protease [Candidatus Acidiferrales bacterium]
MKTEWLALVIAVLLAASPSPYHQSATEGATGQSKTEIYQFSSAEQRAVIPFELRQNTIFLKVKIAGSDEPLDFTFDTGSGSTYLDTAVAKRLGLKPSGSGTVHGAGSGEVPVEYLDSVTLELAGLTSSGHRLKVTNLSGLKPHQDGFVGYDFIKRFAITIDYAAAKMTIADPSTFTYSGPGESFPVKFRGPWPYIDGTVVVSGVKPESGEFLVDSGSSDAVDEPSIAKTTGPVRKVQTGVGLGQPGEGVVGRALYLQLGSFRLEGPIDSCCSENPDQKRMIGTEVLRRFTVILDYARSRIILEPNTHFKDPFPDA